MNWFVTGLKKYADFSGRAQRSEYWYFILFYSLLWIGLAILDLMMDSFSKDLGFGLLSGIFSLGVLVPSISVSVRRLHDTDRSGWWLLIGFVPLVGAIILLVFCLQDSQAGTNRFGPNPKTVS